MPLVNKIGGNQRRAVVVDPRGGGRSTAVVLAVALIAGFLFVGGAAAIYLSQPPASSDPTQIAVASGSPTLPPFVQPTATPSPTPTPTFILLPSDSPSFGTFSPLPTITPPQQTATPGPTTAVVIAKFACTQQGTTLKINCQDNSTGPVESRQWNFGDNQTSTDQNPSNTYAQYKTYTVTLLVTGPGGVTSFRQKSITVQAPPCDNHGQPDGCIASPTPGPTQAPTPTPAPTPTEAPPPSPG